jgi:hypothetical protein
VSIGMVVFRHTSIRLLARESPLCVEDRRWQGRSKYLLFVRPVVIFIPLLFNSGKSEPLARARKPHPPCLRLVFGGIGCRWL